MRFGIKVAYDGRKFHGSQVQQGTDLRTVEGEIRRALVKIGAIEEDGTVHFSSRTDAGVSALGNVFSVDTDFNRDDLLPALSANLTGIWPWSLGKMRPEQNVRWAESRWYRYHMPPVPMENDHIIRLTGALSVFVGRHDFRHMCRLDGDKNTEIEITRAQAYDISGTGEMVIADIVGHRFLWQQVRRMMGAAVAVKDGEMDEKDIERLISGEDPDGDLEGKRGRIRTLPPNGLVLMDVNIKDVDFVPDRRALDLALRSTLESAWSSSTYIILRSALQSLKLSLIG